MAETNSVKRIWININSWKNSIFRSIDFLLAIFFFPSYFKIIGLFSAPGLHAVAEKFFLYGIAKGISAEGDVLEIGSYEGASSLLLALGNKASRKKAKVWLIEPFPLPNKETFINIFTSFGVQENIILINKTSAEAAKEAKVIFRFIFIDGNHEYEYVRNDISNWGRHLASGGIIALHNRRYPGVAKAASELIFNSDRFKVLGIIAETLYATKGDFKDQRLISRFKRLEKTRQKCITFARKIGVSV
ncbi:MAG: class I SAM-dependent methyltransferase [Candidatus Omnitrophota bacterium]|nr:class I SAM-dependent methyltransferase [Candidatus Omnitrophota bacterium]